MRLLIVLGLAALLAPVGCSTNSHMLEPGVDKYEGARPVYKPCCQAKACTCGSTKTAEECRDCCHKPSAPVAPQP